jgi:hypothetical protein
VSGPADGDGGEEGSAEAVAPPPLPPALPSDLPPPAPLLPPPPGFVPPGTAWTALTTTGGYPELTPPVEPLPILTMLPERLKQRRWTVLFRFILAIPLTLVVLFVGIAAFVCVVLGWFAALVMGRVPGFVRTMVTILLRMMLRLEAYTFLLTDHFPSFATDDATDARTRLLVPPATKLNRAAVLFRLILVIPANIAVRITGLGLQIVGIVMWFVVLITGWLPKPVHEAYGVFIRYEVRITGYLGLLVPTYPGELFGDLAPAPVLVPGDAAPEQPATGPDPAARPWMLILGMGAKRLLVVCVVLGVAAAIGLGVLSASIRSNENLVQANNQLVTNLDQFSATAKNCESVSCLEQADGTLSQQLGSFIDTLRSSDGGGVSQSTIDQMIAAAQNTQHVTSALSDAGPSLSSYRSLATRLQTQQSFSHLFSAQHQFVQAVNAARLG